MVNIKTKEINWVLGIDKTKKVDELTNDWIKANADTILDIIDIKYHTQMTDENSESSVLVIYKTK
ncbi:hypothetical protein N9998_00220 [Nitrosopumilus sp.]|nr:hypothetical protein [Nitrosopumilus sp.]|tara:strand:+ start:78 stop:272 length:195 start_codon:yes stop_codon:yes gene_type:complete